MTALPAAAPADPFADAARFDPSAYFLGRTTAWGMFALTGGRVLRRFRVTVDGRHDAGDLVLDEQFAFDDGERSSRVWRIRPTGEDAFVGRADDVVGEARGRVDGPSLRWRYKLRLQTGLVVALDDRMHLQSDGILLNTAVMSKFGAPIGRILIAFQREDAIAPAALAAE